MTTRTRLLSALSMLALAGAACEAQNDGNYKGDPLATIHGTIVNELPSVPPDAEVAIVWSASRAMQVSDKVQVIFATSAERATVTPSFPSAFELDLHLPPPQDLVWDVFGTGMPAAMGTLGVYKKDAVTTGAVDEQTVHDNLIGVATDRLVYLPTPADPYTTAVTGGATTPGLYVLHQETLSEDAAQERLAACRAFEPADRAVSGVQACGSEKTTTFWRAARASDQAISITLAPPHGIEPKTPEARPRPMAGPRLTDEEIERVYRERGHVVLRRAGQILGHEDEAREIVQEVFAGLVSKPAQFNGGSSMTTWLYSVTTHLCLNRLRNQRTRERLLAENATPEAGAVGPAGEARVSVRAFLARLPPRLAQVAVYFHVDEMSHEEIRRVMGTSRRHVGRLLDELEAWMQRERAS